MADNCLGVPQIWEACPARTRRKWAFALRPWLITSLCWRRDRDIWPYTIRKNNHDTRGSDGGEVEAAKANPHGGHALEGSSENHHDEGGHHHGSGERPIFATITIDVCHCGAGCVLGDVVGEWLVYGTNATINGRLLWTDYLVGE